MNRLEWIILHRKLDRIFRKGIVNLFLCMLFGMWCRCKVLKIVKRWPIVFEMLNFVKNLLLKCFQFH